MAAPATHESKPGSAARDAGDGQARKARRVTGPLAGAVLGPTVCSDCERGRWHRTTPTTWLFQRDGGWIGLGALGGEPHFLRGIKGNRGVPLRRTRPEAANRATAVSRHVRSAHNDHFTGGSDHGCAQDEVGADRPDRALGKRGIHARRFMAGLGKELLHGSREVQRRATNDHPGLRQASEVHRIDPAAFHLPALVEVLGIDANRNHGERFAGVGAPVEGHGPKRVFDGVTDGVDLKNLGVQPSIQWNVASREIERAVNRAPPDFEEVNAVPSSDLDFVLGFRNDDCPFLPVCLGQDHFSAFREPRHRCAAVGTRLAAEGMEGRASDGLLESGPVTVEAKLPQGNRKLQDDALKHAPAPIGVEGRLLGKPAFRGRAEVHTGVEKGLHSHRVRLGMQRPRWVGHIASFRRALRGWGCRSAAASSVLACRAVWRG